MRPLPESVMGRLGSLHATCPDSHLPHFWAWIWSSSVPKMVPEPSWGCCWGCRQGTFPKSVPSLNLAHGIFRSFV